MRVLLDVGGQDTPLSDELIRALDVISPNESELERCTGIKADDEVGVVQAAKKLQEKNERLSVLVKLGARGALYIAPDGTVVKCEAV